jgi:hypothetical protein
MAAIPETTQYFPKPGRTPPARLHVVPNPFEEERTACQPSLTWKDILRMRGELPAPKAKRAKLETAPEFVPPYLRKGYRWDLLGEALHEHMRKEASKAAAIRPCPPTLAKLLNTPEWRGSTVEDPTTGDLEQLKASATRALFDAQAAIHAAKGKANKARAESFADAHASRLERLHEARRVVHPAGAVLLWHPL